MADRDIGDAVMEAANELPDTGEDDVLGLETVAEDLETAPEGDEVPEVTEGEEAPPVEEAAAEEVPEGEEPPAGEEPPSDLLEAPEHWNEDYRAAFGRVDKDTQEAWLAQSKDFQRGVSEATQKYNDLAEMADQYRGAAALIEQVAPMWQAQGMSIEGGLGQLIQWGTYLAQSPAEAIPQIAELYGVDLSTLGAEAPYITPEDRHRDAQLRDTNQQLDNVNSQLAEQQHNQTINEIRSFREEVDADGNPTHPFFNDVSEGITHKYNAGFTGSLQEAYDEVVWTNPNVREKLIQQQRTGAVSGVIQQKTETARRAESKASQRVKHAQPGSSGGAETANMSTEELVKHMATKQLQNQRA